MGITTDGVKSIAVIMGNSGTVPTHIAIGDGDTAFSTSDTTLDNETDRNIITTRDLSVGSNVTWTADFSSSEISGTTLREFGLFNASAGGNLFQREVIGSIEFEGERELQIQITHKYY